MFHCNISAIVHFCIRLRNISVSENFMYALKEWFLKRTWKTVIKILPQNKILKVLLNTKKPRERKNALYKTNHFFSLTRLIRAFVSKKTTSVIEFMLQGWGRGDERLHQKNIGNQHVQTLHIVLFTTVFILKIKLYSVA